MTLWVEDLKYHLAMALRTVGIGLAAVAWASVLGSEAQQSADVRAYAQVGAAVLSVCVAQWLTALPPSTSVAQLLRPFARDILTVARERAGGDAERAQLVAGQVTALAAARIRRGANPPRDRRAWLRALADLVELSGRTR